MTLGDLRSKMTTQELVYWAAFYEMEAAEVRKATKGSNKSRISDGYKGAKRGSS